MKPKLHIGWGLPFGSTLIGILKSKSPIIGTWNLFENYIKQFLRPSEGLSIGVKLTLCSHWPDESVHDYYNRFQVVFKENSGLPSDINTTRVIFNSLFVSELNKNLSFLVRRSRMGWRTMTTLDLVNLANELASTIDRPPRRKIAKTFDFQQLQMRGPVEKQRTPTFCHSCKEQCRSLEKKIAVSWSIQDALCLLTSLFQTFLIPSDGVLRNYRGFF